MESIETIEVKDRVIEIFYDQFVDNPFGECIDPTDYKLRDFGLWDSRYQSKDFGQFVPDIPRDFILPARRSIYTWIKKNVPIKSWSFKSCYNRFGTSSRDLAEWALEDLIDTFRNREDQAQFIHDFYVFLNIPIYMHSFFWDRETCYFFAMQDMATKYPWESRFKEYKQWANGEVYRYLVKDNLGNVLDSCGGYYSFEDCKDESISNLS